PTLIGVTATPDRGDGVGLDGIFGEIVDELPMLDLIRAGHLVDLKADQVALKADFNALHTRAGDFVDSETEGVLLNADAPTHVARAYRHLAPDRKGIVFTPTVAVAEAAAEALRGVGIQAESLSGATPMDERRNILAALKTGAVQAVANCAVLTEGYDDPTVSCIAVMKLTKSRGHFVQMIGRGTRTYPGKTDCHILDTVGCSARHDLMTVASLFGLPSDRLKAKTVGQAIAEEEAGAEEPQIVTPHGRLVAASVNLFRARPASWVPTNTGRFVLPGGDGTFVLRPAFGDAWDVLHVPRGQPPRVLATGLTIGYAQGLAEGKAKEMGAAALIDRAAPWRQAAPSEKQVLTLRRFGVPTSAIRTRGEASDAITAAIAAGGV
ncbi:MAG: hypothetical protein H0U10_02270, partial [Chloroflexia bacterium]|nr:hypothetical protein [Chloroflexia bacterium]